MYCKLYVSGKHSKVVSTVVIKVVQTVHVPVSGTSQQHCTKMIIGTTSTNYSFSLFCIKNYFVDEQHHDWCSHISQIIRSLNYQITVLRGFCYEILPWGIYCTVSSKGTLNLLSWRSIDYIFSCLPLLECTVFSFQVSLSSDV